MFSIGSSGRISWLFGQNQQTHFSTETNPISAGQTVAIPSAPNSYLSPDSVPGIEHIYVVYAQAHWKELEERLASIAEGPPRQSVSTGIHLLNQGIKGTIPATNSVIRRALNNSWINIAIVGQPVQAKSNPVIIERWFKHE